MGESLLPPAPAGYAPSGAYGPASMLPPGPTPYAPYGPPGMPLYMPMYAPPPQAGLSDGFNPALSPFGPTPGVTLLCSWCGTQAVVSGTMCMCLNPYCQGNVNNVGAAHHAPPQA